jgi:tetratricopeptide (TPR) repeat protein
MAVSSCSPAGKSTTATRGKTKDTRSALSEEQLINLKYLFVEASKEKMLGNTEKAIELFSQCIRIDGSNHASMYELATLYAGQRKLNDALFFAESASRIDPENDWYKLFLAELYMNARKGAAGEAVYESLYRENPRNVEYAFKYASALLFNGKIQEAIKVYDKVEQEIGVNTDLSVEKERLWLRLGKIDKAAMEIERLIESNPKDIRSYSLLVELYQVNNMPEKAYETIQRMQQVDANSPYVYLALAEYYRSTNQKEKSFENLKLAFAHRDLDENLKMKIISSYLPLVQGNPEMLNQGTELSKILADTHPNDAISLAIHGDFLMIGERYEEARRYYESSLAIDPKNITVWQQLLICQSQISDFAGMLKSAEEALTLFPDQSVFYLFHGVALTDAKRHEEAVKTLLAGSKLVVDNDVQLKDFYIRLADNYNTLKNYTESDKYFEKALVVDPDDPLVLNNYSYYLSLRRENLDRAETMSKRSNEIRPGQPSYEDTYGWILYTMGKYEDARTWLQKALDSGGATNGTILEHMGDVLFRLGEAEKAVEYWKKAKAAGDTSDRIDDKLRDRKLYE